jgi:hypothetical protein
MRALSLRHALRLACAAGCLAALNNSAAAGSFTRGCAARDLQVLELLKERQQNESVPRERLGDAMFAMVHARMVCHYGRVVDALRLYDQVVVGLPPAPLLSKRRPCDSQSPSRD